MPPWKPLCALLLVGLPTLALAACTDEPVPPPACPPVKEQDENADIGDDTGATCNGSALTYESFGRKFMSDYCTRCHSESKKGEDRQCAPDDHNFDTVDEVLLTQKHIGQTAAAGPLATNQHMPPSGPRPTDQERMDLGTWLACEVERMPQ